MKEYRLKQFESDTYIIPIEKVKDFDYLCNMSGNFKYQEYDYGAIVKEDIYEDINQQFSQYIVEGELKNIPLFINPENLK